MQSTSFADVGFLAIVGFIVVVTVAAISATASPSERRRIALRTSAFAIAYLVVTALPTLSGLMAVDGPLPPQAFMGLVLAAAVIFALSRTGGRIAQVVPLWALIGFHGFRLPLELVLHAWAESGVAPPQMTWTGQNPDIATGVIALMAMPLVHRHRNVAWVPTLVGLALLLNIGRIVATSLPGPLMRFPDMLTLPMRFPHVWIGSVCVAAALAAHIIAIRALRTGGSGSD